MGSFKCRMDQRRRCGFFTLNGLSRTIQFVLACNFLIIVGLSARAGAVKYPVVLVPGIAGSQLEAIHDKPQPYPWYCSRLTEWSTVWLRLYNLFPGEAKCFADDISLRYNSTTGEYSSPVGIRVRVRDFGDPAAIEWLDPSVTAHSITAYMHTLVEYFKALGYSSGHDMFAAPYDWRLSPWHMTDYFENLTNLVENASKKNNGAPVIFVSHSMGGPVLQAFFNSVSLAWKQQYVRAFFPVEGPWLGAPKVLLAIVSGDDFGTPAPTDDLLDMERTLESPLYLHPIPEFWPASDMNLLTIISTNTTYTVNNVATLLHDLSIKDGMQRLKYVDSKLSTLRAPQVETYCIHGFGVGTPYHYIYEKLDSHKPTKVEQGDGDGTVPLHSLAYCAEWKSQQNATVSVQTFADIEHVKAIQSTEVFDYIGSVIKSL